MNIKYILPVFVLLGLLTLSCERETDCYTKTKETYYTITLSVTGTASSVDILRVFKQDETQDTTYFNDATLPWETDTTTIGDSWVYLVAHNNDSTGTVTAAILLNGNEVVHETRSGAFVQPAVSWNFLGEDYTEEYTECP
ncbi:MAG: hypothetical protein GXO92_02320 [FCB group bacterium]|nr:hypothetical protein [FCB group bacterium]